MHLVAFAIFLSWFVKLRLYLLDKQVHGLKAPVLEITLFSSNHPFVMADLVASMRALCTMARSEA